MRTFSPQSASPATEWLRVLPVVAILFVNEAARADIELRASVDRTQAAVGERITLTVEASGAQNVPAPDIGSAGSLQVQYLGPSTHVSIVNGQMDARVSHRYALVAPREGQFRIGPFHVDHGGKRYEAPAIMVHVTAQAQQRQAGRPDLPGQGQGEIRLGLSGLKENPYVGERIPVEIILYVGNVRVDQLQYPKVEGEGFVLDRWAEPTQRDEIIGGRRFRSVRFTSTLTPLRVGSLTLSPTMDMAVLRSRRGGLGDFFGDMFAERSPYQARAADVTLEVRPLPEAGRPADFSGAVGQFEFLLDVRPTELNAGDPITVRMEIRGQGNLEGMNAPSVAAGDRFRRYDAVAVKQEQATGRRVFEQVIIPREAGIGELPPVHFTFFDPSSESYRTITRGPVSLTVHASQVAQEPVLVVPPDATSAAAHPPEKLGRDIVYIKDVPGELSRRGRPFYGRPWFLLLQLLPPLGFAAMAMWVRRRERLAADPRLVRFRLAGREARQALAALRGQTADGARFYDDLAAALRSYLAAKLDLPPGAVDRESVLDCLSRNGTPAEIRLQVGSLFELVEQARYAPNAAGAAERGTALRLAQELVDRLDRDRRLAVRFAAAALVLLLPAMAVLAQVAAFDPHTSFFEGNAAYKAGRYADAIAAYEAVLGAGLESGALHFNLGNACFKEGQLGRAVLSYERARRLLPRDADVRANLYYAREQADDAPEPRPFWERLIFPLASRATTGELAAATSVAWFLLWTALAVRIARRRWGILLGRVAAVLAVVLAMTGASLGARLTQVDWARPAVVTAAGETAVRFEPTESGTTHFSVTEGIALDVQEIQEGWLQVRRRDGRRGWVPAEAVSFVSTED
jgi:tetratricopeptide (TPR) repeat protein